MSSDKYSKVFIKPDPSLHRDQLRALNVMRGQAKCDSIDALPSLSSRYTEFGYSQYTPQAVLRYIAESSPMITHVSESTLGILLDDTHYRSTFETNTKKEPYLQMRKSWESECFHALYDGVVPFERPKYGVINILNDPAGVKTATSYGECYFEYAPHVRKRITIATGDTASARVIGVPDFCAHVVNHFSKRELCILADIVENKVPFANYINEQYREIQIHGEVDIARDIAALHIPAGKLTETVAKFQSKFCIDLVEFQRTN